ncbi:HAMP domain-containing histidine kinase [SAR92 clade bacterium H455]|uniref:histidine kinase n=1 Tax=SAR92 clade bacterium H455 TaxID=2974818 RepID=A0ABY5TKK8_9GAMM|nr:HAMP domain-containing histidine kinase [SAR92 clade bacterium H455]
MQEASRRNRAPSRLLKLYSSYRLFLSALLLWLGHLDSSAIYFDDSDSGLFSTTAAAYLIASLLNLPLFQLLRWRPNETLLFAMLLVDVVAINLMLYSSGGMAGSMGYLLMVTVAASGTFLKTRLALSIAAIASFIPVSIAMSEFLFSDGGQTEAVRSGVFGILLFATAAIFIYLTKRLTLVQALAESESRAATRLQHINDLVFNKMLTGIIVFDSDFCIEQLNERASLLLGPSDSQKLLARHDSLDQVSELLTYYHDWKANPQRQLPTFLCKNSDIPLQISFSEIHSNSVVDTILFIEDARTLSQHAQQLKNSSLGALTSSIAHEIRNPLGAISHAAQLLQESQLDQADQQLVDVVLRHSSRMDNLVQDILQLSRQQAPQISVTNIFANCMLSKTQVQESNLFNNPQIEIDASAQSVNAPFDSSQLQQVLVNLISNALRHSEKKTGQPWVAIRFDYQTDMNLAMLKIYDRGEGVSDANKNKIFEPFFTTEKQGLGLGLYIARELCEINFATLSYVYKSSSEGYFKIVFSDPAKLLPRNAENEQDRSDR